MKVVGEFRVATGLVLAALPLMSTGDDALAGRLRSYLSYGSSLLAIAVSVLTIFLSIWVVSEDVRSRQVFSVVVKPLARWQYLLGRWLGVSLLCVGLLLVGSGVIFVMTHYLASGAIAQPANVQDELAVEAEVLVARQKVFPNEIADLEEQVAQRLVALKSDAEEYEQTLEAFMTRTGGDREQAEQALIAELAEDVAKGLYAIRAGQSTQWTFAGINLRGETIEDVGRVVGIDTERNGLAIRAPREVLQRAIYDGPIFVNEVYEGRVRLVRGDVILLEMLPNDMAKADLQAVDVGEDVALRVDPMIQLTYKADLGRRTADGRFSSQWRFENPTTGFPQTRFRDDPEGTPATLTISARVIDEQGSMRATFTNRRHSVTGEMSTLTILPEDVAVLFRVSGFSGNFGRGVLLLTLQVLYLAGVGVFAGSFLVFPVACLLSLSMLPFSLAGQFLREAVDPQFLPEPLVISYYLVRVMSVLLPDFESTSPSEWLVGGLYIPWSFVGRVALWTLVVRTGRRLTAGCLLFSRRELARVQT
jgi:ABC-type transport system involved in multi-copper enzyme maturation permease subunit